MKGYEWTVARRHGAMLLVCLVGVFNLVDRQIMTILLEPIKLDFGASDTQMGLLTGSIFAAFYVFASIPLARLADRYPRRLVIGSALAIWSVLTALGGATVTFTQLAITRLGVAVGEAGSGAATYSIISDLYPLKHRSKAFACYSAATSIGVGGAVIVGGWLVDEIGWRMTLLAVGAPGLLLSLIIFAILREPVRGMADDVPHSDEGRIYGLGETLRHLWGIPGFPLIFLVCGVAGTTGYGLLAWAPTFLIRNHGMNASEIGLYFGSVSIISMVTGQLSTGVVLDIAARFDRRAYMWFVAGGCLLSIPFGLVFTLADDWRWSIAGFGVLYFLMSPYAVCCSVVTQTLAPPRMRATAAMILGLGTALFGTGLGPLFIGIANDLLVPYAGDRAIRISLSLNLGFLALSATGALLAARFVRKGFLESRLGRNPSDFELEAGVA